MSEHDKASFSELIQKLRDGDEDAAGEIVRRYEPEIRRRVRLRLRGVGLRRLLDSMDICQSVLGRFFVRAALGELDLENPEHLKALLVKMARERVVDWQRRLYADRRDKRRERDLASIPTDSERLVGKEPNPMESVAASELLQEFRKRLTGEERKVADLRAKGYTWIEIGNALGEDHHSVRKRLVRARERVAGELGLQ